MKMYNIELLSVLIVFMISGNNIVISLRQTSICPCEESCKDVYSMKMQKSLIPSNRNYLNSSLKNNETPSDRSKQIMTKPDVQLDVKNRNAQVQRLFALNMKMTETNSKSLNNSQININTKAGLRDEKVTTRKESYIEDTSNAIEFSTSTSSSTMSNQKASSYANYTLLESNYNSTSND